jgi:hypothetical protein
MEKHNFDFIFAVEDREQQIDRMKHTIMGLERLLKDAEAHYARAFIVVTEQTDPAVRFKQVEQIEEGMTALMRDPRTTDLGKWVAKQNAEKLGSTLASQIIDALTRK